MTFAQLKKENLINDSMFVTLVIPTVVTGLYLETRRQRWEEVALSTSFNDMRVTDIKAVSDALVLQLAYASSPVEYEQSPEQD